MTASPPGLISAANIRMRNETPEVRIGYAVDVASHRSPLAFGFAWIDPQTEPTSWDADDTTNEVYYVTAGALKISWTNGSDAGQSTVTAGDCFYFSPGHTYTIEGTGDQEITLVWALTPAPEEWEPPASSRPHGALG